MSGGQNLQGDIRPVVAAARQVVVDRNWYAAIVLSLALPDICASIDDPGKQKARKRYSAWWDQYAAHRFWIKPDPGETWQAHSLLVGSDAFFVRSAVLHAADETLDDTRRVKHRVQFVERGSYGQSRDERVVSVGVDYLVDVVCDGVETWLIDRQDDFTARARIAKRMIILEPAITYVDFSRHEAHPRCQSAFAAGWHDALQAVEAMVSDAVDRSRSGELAATSDLYVLKRQLRSMQRDAHRKLTDARQVVGNLP